jgi:hypothetical protein
VFGGVASRVATLRRLCTIGVEIETELDEVATTESGDNRQYVAKYHYVFAGRSFPLRVSAMIRRWATRFGQRPVVLLDAAHPEVAVVLR